MKEVIKKNKIYLGIGFVFLLLLLLLILGMNRAVKKDQNLSLSYLGEKTESEVNIEFIPEKVVKRTIRIQNNSSQNKTIEITLKDINLEGYMDTLVYYLYDDKNEIIEKGILHDDIKNQLGSFRLKEEEEKEVTLTIEGVNQAMTHTFSTTGIIMVDEKKEEEISTLYSYSPKDYKGLNERMRILANSEPLNSYDDEENVKSIKLAKEMDKRYQTDDYIVSTETSSKPIYMWYEDNTIYFYSENKIALPEESYNLFGKFVNLSDIEDLKYFDVSQVTNMSSMFSYDTSLSNIDAISYWKTPELKNMGYMFISSKVTNTSSLAGLDTRKVTDMDALFSWSDVVNLSGLKYWDVSKVEKMGSMFDSAEIEELDALKDWDVSSLKNIQSMFRHTKIKNVDGLKEWDTKNLEDISFAFYGSMIENVDGLKNWNTKKLEKMAYTFTTCIHLINIDGLKDWDTSSLTDLAHTFDETRIKEVDALKNWNTSKVVTMEETFSGARELSDISGLENFDVSKVKSMKALFYKTHFKDTTPLQNWDTFNVTNMDAIFSHSKIENTKGIDHWDLSKVTSFESAFSKTEHKPKWNGTWTEEGTFVKEV